MKNIKSFKQFESNNDDDILSLLIFLEESSKKLNNFSVRELEKASTVLW